MKTLITDRLELSAWKLGDAPDLFSYAKNPNVGPPAGWPPHRTIWDSVRLIVEVLKPGGTFAIRPKDTGKAIGTISLSEDEHRKGLRARELGYSMSEDYWGQGLMTEAAMAVIRHGFEELRLDMISVTTGPENLRSQSVIKKCGFTYEGTLRKAFAVYDGTVRDVMCYSMTKEEFFGEVKEVE